MELSSLRRLRKYCGKLSDTEDINNALMALLLPVSAAIEQYLKREIELKERTEKFDTSVGQRVFFPKAYPIVSISSIYHTVTGKFEGEEVLETDYHNTYNDSGFVLRQPIGRYLNALKSTYTGGLAEDPVRSTFTIGSVGASAFEEKQYVRGSRSRAVGVVVSNDPGTEIIIENIYGKFRIGDVLTAYQREDLSGTAITATTGTITAIVSQSLAEAHPNIVMATDFEVNFLYRNSTNSSLWISGTNKEGTTKRSPDTEGLDLLQLETRMMLRGYERVLM